MNVGIVTGMGPICKKHGTEKRVRLEPYNAPYIQPAIHWVCITCEAEKNAPPTRWGEGAEL